MRFSIWVEGSLWHQRAGYHAVRDASSRVCESRPPFVDLVITWGQRLVHRAAIAFHRKVAVADDRLLRAMITLEDSQAAAKSARAEADQARAVLLAKQAEADQLHETLNPPSGPWTVARSTYKLAILAICVGDLPFTYLAFQTFDLDPVMTLVVSGLVVLMLGALGHFAGHYARRLRWREGLLLAVVITLAIGFVVSLTYLRETAMRAIVAAEAMDPIGPILVFATVTALGFVVPALLAYHVRQEPSAHMVRLAERRWRRSERSARRLERRLASARRTHQWAYHRRQALGAETQDRIEIIKQTTNGVLHKYRLHFVREREGAEPPGMHPDQLPTIAYPARLLAELERSVTAQPTGGSPTQC